MADLTPVQFLAGLCGLGLLVVLALSLWSKRETRLPARTSHRALTDSSTMPEPLRAETVQLLADGRKIEAIKRVRETTGWDLKRAKEVVEHIQHSMVVGPQDSVSQSRDGPEAGAGLDGEIRRLLADRKRIEAVKLVRDRTGWGLEQSKGYVERIGAVRSDDYQGP